MLHIAPESMFEPKFRKLVGNKYITADFLVKADVKMDITDIKYKAETFNIIMCNHVLEHIVDDSKAMKELFRVQKRGGWSVLLAPIANTKGTYEDRRITREDGRLRAFGQKDHMREYGTDYAERLRESGYDVEVYKATDIATKREIKKMSLQEKVKKTEFLPTSICFCSKRANKEEIL